MLVFIDEAGRFIPGDQFSTVVALSLPNKSAGLCRRDKNRASATWPRRNGELKSAALGTSQVKELVEILYGYDAVLHAVCMNVSVEGRDDALRHQRGQAEGITRYLVPDHSESFRKSVWDLRHALERMPQQLYLQCVTMHHLAWLAVEELPTYFAQRKPRELGRFEWRIDAKDPMGVTSQESWWRDVIGPLGESRSRREPFFFVDDPAWDYSYFDAAFGTKKEMWYPDRPREVADVIDIKKMIVDHVRFQDSRSDILLQAADILAGAVRRCVRQKQIDEDILGPLGRLMIRRKIDGAIQTVRLITVSKEDMVPTDVGRRLRLIAEAGRSMTGANGISNRRKPITRR